MTIRLPSPPPGHPSFPPTTNPFLGALGDHALHEAEPAVQVERQRHLGVQSGHVHQVPWLVAVPEAEEGGQQEHRAGFDSFEQLQRRGV